MQSVFKHNLFLFCNQMPIASSFLLTNTIQITFLSLFFPHFLPMEPENGDPRKCLAKLTSHPTASAPSFFSRSTIEANHSKNQPINQRSQIAKNKKRINNKTRKKKIINKPRAVLNQTVLKMA